MAVVVQAVSVSVRNADTGCPINRGHLAVMLTAPNVERQWFVLNCGGGLSDARA